MWYIFPQLEGLGYNDISKFYGIKNINEAREFLKHPILGDRLRKISMELLKLEDTNVYSIFGKPDDSKLKSCMTLFSRVDETDDDVFKKVIELFFKGHFDKRTLRLLNTN